MKFYAVATILVLTLVGGLYLVTAGDEASTPPYAAPTSSGNPDFSADNIRSMGK